MRTKSDILGEALSIKPLKPESNSYIFKLETLDDLLKRDEQREKDGFKKKIKIGKITGSSGKSNKNNVVVVPTTTEDKLLHSPFNPDSEDATGGEGEGEEGDVVGEKSIDEDDGEEGEGEGEAGSGSGGEHGLDKEIYETGKFLTEQFQLPNIKDKGKKVAIPQYRYDLTDTNEKTGQVLDKKKTLKAICKTNINLGRLDKDTKDTKNLIVRPDDKIYRILSKERMYESQAIVFLCRDYSGSMTGKPTEVVVKQHMMIYAWLVYQYQDRVIPRFILHDTEAKEVNDFDTYHRSKIAGGTRISSAYKLINDIVQNENLDRDYNIYIFHGTDGDDWQDSSDQTLQELVKMVYANRIGITVAKNMFDSGETVIERKINESKIKTDGDILRLDAFKANDASEDRIIDGIKYLISE
ncbi:MAG: DUF444 family protein [Candidatus Woesearchaeota archaeon]